MKLTIAILSLLILGACSSSEKSHSIGRGTDDYKESPCACVEIHPSYKNQWSS